MIPFLSLKNCLAICRAIPLPPLTSFFSHIRISVPLLLARKNGLPVRGIPPSFFLKRFLSLRGALLGVGDITELAGCAYLLPVRGIIPFRVSFPALKYFLPVRVIISFCCRPCFLAVRVTILFITR